MPDAVGRVRVDQEVAIELVAPEAVPPTATNIPVPDVTPYATDANVLAGSAPPAVQADPKVAGVW